MPTAQMSYLGTCHRRAQNLRFIMRLPGFSFIVETGTFGEFNLMHKVSIVIYRNRMYMPIFCILGSQFAKLAMES